VASLLQWANVSSHVIQVKIPTPTIPPSFETNCYVIHDNREAFVIDVGTSDQNTLDELVSLLKNQQLVVKGLIATHHHHDHTVGLPFLQQVFSVPIFVHPMDMERAQIAMDHAPDVRPIPTQLSLHQTSVQLQHFPGHTHGHIHIEVQPDGVLLVGDHLSGEGTVWIGPPDGHLEDYFHALDAIMQTQCQWAGPGHGNMMENPAEAARIIKHRRLRREQDIVRLIQTRPMSIHQLVDTLYSGTLPEAVRWVATRMTKAHVTRLMDLKEIVPVYDTKENVFTYQIEIATSGGGTA
jgi:endoribonuclease LACTB2